MNKKSGTSKDAAGKLVRGIKRKARKHYSAEEKIRIVLAGLRGDLADYLDDKGMDHVRGAPHQSAADSASEPDLNLGMSRRVRSQRKNCCSCELTDAIMRQGNRTLMSSSAKIEDAIHRSRARSVGH